MTSTETQTILSTAVSPMTTTTALKTTTDSPNNDPIQNYRTALLAIYTVVLLSGTISLAFMVHILKSSTTSITSIAVLNLIFAHFIFLITVPFRIYYHATQSWSLGQAWCKVVSSMIHTHMYMSFAFYVVILITRLLSFYKRVEATAPFQRIQALLLSGTVWILVLVSVPFIITFSYGGDSDNNSQQCFNFAYSIKSGAKVINYIASIVIIVVATVLTALQANILRVLHKKYREGCTSQQEFGAQLKSMCFALIMVVCFVPYHMFRLHYLEHLDLEGVNEVFLSLTTFNCLDMLTFLGRRNCYTCFLWRA